MKMLYTILYYTILFSTILYYTILYYTILYYTTLHYASYAMLCYAMLCYAMLHYTILYVHCCTCLLHRVTWLSWFLYLDLHSCRNEFYKSTNATCKYMVPVI